eukprot:6097560-Pyramimonas_sp.AAC.1
MLSYYRPTAERLDYLPISTPRSTTILGMNTMRKICRISSFVVRLLYLSTIFDDFMYENNRWVLGWIRYHHGLHWPKARALAR